ncbi:MAG: ABC transporter substrate-binding protein [Pseudomonadota bacterium]
MTRLALSVAATALLATGALADGHDPRPELVIGMNLIQRAHPAVAESNYDSRVIKSVMDGLLNRDWAAGPNRNGTEIVPGLFTEWEQIDDLTWEFKMRPGVVFHNGREMTIEDVHFTLSAERLWGPEAIRPHAMAGSFASVDIVDEETLRLTTKAPDPVLLQRLAHVIGHVVPAEEYRELGPEGFAAAPIGTGPYKWETYVSGDELILSAHDDYWGSKPPFRRIVFKAVPENSSRIAGLITGQYDIITSVPPDQAELIDREEGYRTAPFEVENIHILMFISGCGERTEEDCAADPSALEDKRLRQAMVHAVDREQIADRLWGGLAKVPAGPNFPFFGELYEETRTPLAYDPERAKALMEETGYDGEEIVVTAVQGYYVNGDRALQVMQQMWQAVGLNVNLQFIENWTQQRPYGEVQDSFIVSANLRVPDPLSPWWWNYAAPAGFYQSNGILALSDEYIEVGEAISSTLDVEERKALWTRALDIWQDELPGMIFYRPIEILGVRDCLGWEPYSFYWMDFRAENVTAVCDQS